MENFILSSLSSKWHSKESMMRIMENYGLQPKFIALLENLYKRTENAVILAHENTDWFKQTVGVRQGCIMSPGLFLYIEHIMRVALHGLEQVVVRARIGGRRLNNLRFADIIGLIKETLKHAQALLDRVDR